MTLRDTLISAGAVLALGVFAVAPSAQAALTITATVGGRPMAPGFNINFVNFDGLALGSSGGTSGGLGVSFAGGAQTASGLSSAYTPPMLSDGMAASFGDPTVSGPDATPYLSTGLGTVTLTLPQRATYLGLLWGSVDYFNTLSFYSNSALVGTASGADVTPQSSGNVGADGTVYVNILSTMAFDSVVAASGGYSFEFDNVALGSDDTPVPEPLSLGLVGLGLTAIAGQVRRRRRGAREDVSLRLQSP